MQIIRQENLTEEQKTAVLNIWNEEYPAKLQMPDMLEFNKFLSSLVAPKHYLLIDKKHKIEGWAAVFSAETVRCFFIMVNSTVQGHGYGTLLLNGLKADERSLFGWVIDHDNDIKANGQSYRSPLNFYVKNNFTVNTGLRWDTDLLSTVNIIWDVE